MDASQEPKVIEAERLDGGVAIGFEDGRVGLYSSELLRSMLPMAQDITDAKLDD